MTARYKGLRYSEQHLLESDDSLMVNPVNVVGAMGAGVALRFAEAFPEMNKDYRFFCKSEMLRIGTAFLWASDQGNVLNLPTKNHYRNKSTLDILTTGVALLGKIAHRYPTIGMVEIGCGLGGLDWTTQVEPLIREQLVAKHGIGVTIYSGTVPHQTPRETSRGVLLEIVSL